MALSNRGLKAIAILEAGKGLLSLIVALGLHLLLGHNLQHIAVSLVSHAHLNPASHYPSEFIHAAGTITESKVNLLTLGSLAYSLIRFIEAYGLWKAFVWTEWLALLSGAIYLPFEIYNMFVKPSMVGVGVFILNLIVVLYMIRFLWAKKRSNLLNSSQNK